MTADSRLLVRSLLERVVKDANGLYRLEGAISPSEYHAIHVLLGAEPPVAAPTEPEPLPEFVPDLRLLEAEPVTQGLLCVDFGTAASKVGYDPGNDTFEPLAIGNRAGEGAPFWAVSAIAFDADGRMVFGTRATAASAETGEPALTSFKSRLWADPNSLDHLALTLDGVEFTLRDCIIAYLAFLDELAKQELREKGVSPYTPRRYAMPYAYDEQRKGIRVSLADMLGSATILSDTLGSDLIAGVDYRIMRAALNAVQEHKAPRWLVMECVGEPVAAGNFAMDEEVEQLTVYMIVDIGAGTTDFSVLCIKKPVSGDVEAIQIANGSLTIELAGNAVDKALVDFLVRQEAGEEHRATLAAAASSMKERLFAPTAAEDERFDQEVTGGMLINVDRQEFLASPEWKAFADSLASAQAACFDKAQRSYLQGYGPSGSPIRVVMTGGGANLPLVEELATGRSKGEVKLVRNYVADFPITIQQRFAEILPDLPRLAVALGGSRPELPAQSDRTDAQPGPKAPIRVQGPADKTATGLGSGDSDSFGG